MKRFYFLAILFLGLLLPSCKQDAEEPVDCDPPIITFEIVVTDADGNVIIKGENGEERIRELLTIEYQGYTSSLKKKGEQRASNEQPFHAVYDKDNNPTSITYGFFFSSKNYKDETITLKWKDGTQDIVKFSTSYKYAEYFNKSASLNGTEITEWGEDGVTPIIRKIIK